MATSRVDERRMRRRKSHSELEGKKEVTLALDVCEVRRIRIERLESGITTTRRTEAIPRMTSESQTTLPSVKSRSSHRRKKDRQNTSGDAETRHHRRKKSAARNSYVYSSPAGKSQSSRINISAKGTLAHDEESSDSGEDSTRSEPVQSKPRKRKIKIVYVDEDDYISSKPKERRSWTEKGPRECPRDVQESVRRSRAIPSRRHSVVNAAPVSSHRRYSLLSFVLFTANYHPLQKYVNERSPLNSQTHTQKK
jgi:hypothetical protein